MASGDIKQFGMWKCISSNAVSYKTGGYWPYSIYYSEYSNGVTLVDYDSSKCSDDPIEWIEYDYNGKTVYIQNKLFFYSISITESLRMCSNNIYIDGVKYKLSFMPKEFWTNLPSSICTLFKTDTSKKFYTNSPFYTDSTSYYYSVYFDGNSFSYDSESIGENTVDETYAFVPVLVQDNSSNDVPDGTVVKIGAITLNRTLQTQQKSNEHINQYYSTNAMPKVSLVDTRDESKKWSWLKFTDGGTKKYMCTSGIFLGCSYAGLTKSIKTVKIENTIYDLRFPTYDEFVVLAEANLLGKINNYMDNGHDSSYHVITSSGGCASFLVHSQNISSQIDSLDFTSYADDDFDEQRLVIPILVERGVPDGPIVEMGTWRLLSKNATHYDDQNASYYSKGACHMYNYKHVQLRDRNSYSGDAVAEMVEYIYNGEKLYIPLFAVLSCTNEEANRIVCFIKSLK